MEGCGASWGWAMHNAGASVARTSRFDAFGRDMGQVSSLAYRLSLDCEQLFAYYEAGSLEKE